MKKNKVKNYRNLISLLFVLLIISSCKKESTVVNHYDQDSNQQITQSSLQNSSRTAGPINHLVGTYGCSGLLRYFVGNRADSIIQGEFNLSDLVPSKTMSAINSRTLTCDYGASGVAGWKYIITYDPITKHIILSPNDIMYSQIKVGSFVTFSATFDQLTKTFNFVTGYTISSGNDRTTYETLIKQ